jgi:hypothetical protein
MLRGDALEDCYRHGEAVNQADLDNQMEKIATGGRVCF